MAKRKRLSPIAQPAPAGTGPETRSIAPPPIADVAGSVAREAAFDAVSDELAAARAEGRMVASLPLDSIEAGHLERDRLYADPEEMLILCDSIRDRGQQTPIEVEEIGGEKYGLISGWRRLMALRALCGQDADPRFARVQALIRTPENTVAAYRAMVEENEIRADLSHYERARIAVLATQKGVFPSAKIAVRTLFAAARAPKRSKILSFTVLVEALAPHVTFPTALPEKLGLALVAALEADPTARDRIVAALQTARPDTPDAERSLLERCLRPETPPAEADIRQISVGLQLRVASGKLTLSGPAADATLARDIEAWLASRGA